ncbi:MAG: superoxide dismutase family protein [Myxococcales bacterium FL481]|nr:MAG: superoxide dismutase family protein [Myxococcales bacterium FL481]
MVRSHDGRKDRIRPKEIQSMLELLSLYTSRYSRYLLPLLSGFVFGCDEQPGTGSPPETGVDDAGASEDTTTASAKLTASASIGNPAPDVAGHGTLSVTDESVTLELSVTGCPEGDHGLHIHTGTECGSDGSSAMGHWDPSAVGEDDPSHAGNVGIVSCTADRLGTLQATHPEWSLESGSSYNPTGLTVVLHGLDKKQRIACGTIEAEGEGLKFTLEPRTLTANPAAGIQAQVNFQSVDTGVRISAEVTGCPEGSHGFHIHEGTECGADGKLAGAHWDPTGLGADDPAHVGNLGAIMCGAGEVGVFEFSSSEMTLAAGDSLNPVGLTMVLHGIDPANRVACGVITNGR